MLEANETFDDASPAQKPGAKSRRNKRRRGVDQLTIGVAALIALGGAGLYYMHTRTAHNIEVIEDATANAESVQSLLTGGREGLVALSRGVAQTRQTIDNFSRRDEAILASAKLPERDPFEFKSLEPTATTPRAGTNQAAREAARMKALESARKLQLQSIMFGTARRSCLIDGKLYFEGQSLGDFTIAQIAPGSITVQNGEFKFELRLRK